MKALRSNRVKIFLTVFLVYLFYISPNYLNSHTNRYIILTKAIVDDGTFNIDNYYQKTRDWGNYKGHYYLGAAPGISLMAVPLYVAIKPIFKIVPENIYHGLEFDILNMFFTLFLSVLPGSLIAVLLYNLLKEFHLKERQNILLVFATSFGTTLFYYSTKLVAHPVASFLLFAAFYILFKARNSFTKNHLFLLAGLSLGTAVLCDYLMFIGCLFIILYYLACPAKNKILSLSLLFIGSLPALFMYMYYHYICFGNPFSMATAYSQMVGSNAISMPKPWIMFELSFGTYRGLFLYMPILLLSLYGIFVFFKKPIKEYLHEMFFVTFFSVCIFLIISGLSLWDAGGDFGPRYLLRIIPFFMIPIAFIYGKVSYKIIFCFTAISIFINWCGVQYGDTDNVFTNIGLFIFMGLNSNLAEWFYKITDTYIRKLNVITHFSPLLGFPILVSLVYFIWKEEIDRNLKLYFCK